MSAPEHESSEQAGPVAHAAGTAPRRSAGEAVRLRRIAVAGLRGPAASFPFESRIREAFGRYAPPRLEARQGRQAALAGEALSAKAYAFGHRAAFTGRPELHTAAHEAAHIAASGLGARVRHGVGAPGDVHERVADRAADAAVRGQSAEPVFQAAYGEATPGALGPAQLQMYNKIDTYTASKKDTPWYQISQQLDLDTSLQTTLESRGGGFATMAKTLKASCERAESVTAELDGVRHGGPRSSDDTQTAYGNLGNFMAAVTGTPIAEPYEGGHLVSDEILGDWSYVQYNFAPQLSHLNAPYYRKIEEIAAAGAERTSGSGAVTPSTYKIDLTYDQATIKVPTATVTKQLGISQTEIAANPVPAHVTLNTWVPHLWKAKLTAGDTGKEVFSHVSRIDTRAKTGAPSAFIAGEANAEAMAGGPNPDTLNKVDIAYWSMDTLKHEGVMDDKELTTGEDSDRHSEHTWTGVQSAPRSQTGTQSGFTASFPQPLAPSLPSFPEPLGLTGWQSNALPTIKKGTASQFAKDMIKKRPKSLKLPGVTNLRALKAAIRVFRDYHLWPSLVLTKGEIKHLLETVQKKPYARNRKEAVQNTWAVRALMKKGNTF